jgi:protein-tyrosine phosphatase
MALLAVAAGGQLFGCADPAGRAGFDAGPCTAAGDGGACTFGRPVLTCDVPNARDLGGVAVGPGGGAGVSCGQLFRGPPLAGLSARGCTEAARLGIRTVIDLRTDDERLAWPDDACIGATFVNAPLPIPYDVSAANYIADFDATTSIARVFQTLADPSAYPIYFHCTYGRDRTGVVAAAVLLVLGASRDDIMREYSLSLAAVGAHPASLSALLDEIERRGGIDASLQAAGVSGAALAGIRAQLVPIPPSP